MMAAITPQKYIRICTNIEIVDDLHEAANKVCSAYDDLIRLGRRKLAVE
jgi:hypothetical protein